MSDKNLSEDLASRLISRLNDFAAFNNGTDLDKLHEMLSEEISDSRIFRKAAAFEQIAELIEGRAKPRRVIGEIVIPAQGEFPARELKLYSDDPCGT